MYPLFTVYHFLVSDIRDQRPNTHIRSHNNSLLCLFVCLFTPGTYQDCEEASGDGLIVSGNRSAGAGAGEKCSVSVHICDKQIFFFFFFFFFFCISLISVRWEQCRPSTGALPNSGLEMPENCESVLSSRRTTVRFVRNESARQASYKEWPQKCKGLWEYGDQFWHVIACCSSCLENLA